MIWIALLFALIFGATSSSSLVPNLDKHVKKHVVEKSRKKQVLVFVKEDQKQRKSAYKVQKKNIKELGVLFASRNATMEDFEKVFVKILDERQILQAADVKVKLETQNYIEADEWDLIVIDTKKDFTKIKKKTKKNMTKLANNYDKFEEELNNIMVDENRKKEVHAALIRFEQLFSDNLKAFGEYIDDDSSIIYKHKTTSEELIEVQDKANVLRKEIFQTYAETHFKMVENTTEEEWKPLAKKMKKFY
jgi:hypothetical protein